MNKLFISAILFLLFLFNSQNALAYDLSVQCDDSRCSLSSNAPVFEPGVNWAPGKQETREVKITNTGDFVKDIFLRVASEGQQGALDDYMNIRLFEAGAAKNIWSGTLAELLTAETVLVSNFSKDEEFTLNIQAQMDTSTPNNMQGSASTFDFGFGFDGEYKNDENEDGKNSDSSNNNNLNSSSTGGITSNAASTEGNLDNFLTNFLFDNNADAEEDVEGERDEEVRGAITNQIEDECRDSNVWILAIILQLAAFSIYITRKHDKHVVVAQILTFLVSVVTIILTSCILWPLILASGIFMVAVLKYSKRLSSVKVS